MPRKLRSESWLRLSRNGQSTKCGPALKALVKRWLSSRPKCLLLFLLIGKPLGQFTAWRVVPESPAMCLSGVSASLGGNPGRVIVQREVSAAGTGPCQRSRRQPGAGGQTQPLESTAPALGGGGGCGCLQSRSTPNRPLPSQGVRAVAQPEGQLAW